MKIGSKLALVAALALPSFAMAATPNTGNLSLSGGIDYASNYYFRGYLQENSGVLYQPYAGVSGSIIKSDDFSLNATVKTWNSIHTEKTLAESGPSQWYESDLTGQLDFVFDKFTISAIYTLYMYPNGAFKTISEVGLAAAYDDSELYKGTPLEGVSLNPYIGVYHEVDDGNGGCDTYGEVGISPGYTFKVTDSLELPVKFPILVGVSVDNYYIDSSGSNTFFGYGSIGVTTSLPMTFIPAEYGNWYLNLAGTYTSLFADSAEAANNDESNVFTGRVGISFAY